MTGTTVETDVEALERLTPEWEALAEDTDEPNPFYEPFVLLPALEHLAAGADVRVLFLRAPDGELLGVVPLERHRWSAAVPVPHFSTWRHRYGFLSTPVVRRGKEAAAVDALFTWLGNAGIAGRFLRLLGHVEGGPFDQALDARARKGGLPVRVTASYERAFVPTGPTPEAYFETLVTSKRRQEIRRKRKRLADLGAVTVVQVTERDEVAAWLPTFLAIEDGGWKGEMGTSMATNPKDRAFLEAVVRRSRGRHRLELLAIKAGETTIAATVNLRSGRGMFNFKMGYDEAHAALSPGVLLEWEFLAQMLAEPGTSFVDSCAAAESITTLGSFWSGRRRIRALDLAAPSPVGRGLLALGEPLQDLESRTRAWFRELPPTVQRPFRQLLGG